MNYREAYGMFACNGIKVDRRYFRPTEVDMLLGDPSKAKQLLGWSPQIGFNQLVEEMMASDSELAKRDALISREGYKAYSYHE